MYTVATKIQGNSQQKRFHGISKEYERDHSESIVIRRPGRDETSCFSWDDCAPLPHRSIKIDKPRKMKTVSPLKSVNRPRKAMSRARSVDGAVRFVSLQGNDQENDSRKRYTTLNERFPWHMEEPVTWYNKIEQSNQQASIRENGSVCFEQGFAL